MKSSLCLFFALFLSVTLVHAQKPALPTGTVPDGLGYNIHFTHAKPGEMEMIAESGATIIRMDFGWGGTEREKGVYDFKAFEHLTDSLEKHDLRPLYILDYSNRHYDGGLSPHSEEGRTAFANWAAAAAVHFKDRGILWEMYNEPNIQFWKPKPEPEKYILLALEVGRALRQAAPNELYIGPGTAQSPVHHTIDFDFLEQCFKAGLLEYWDAVSVHPYRQSGPETVAEEYARLRHLIDKYAPKVFAVQRRGASELKPKHIPILSGEWGYSSVWGNFDDEKQGKMLPRQWMMNLAFQVPISIWYDWHDDGQDPKEPEHHFGTTNFAYNQYYKKDQKPVYDPKPSYIAAKTFCETFKGFRFNKRLWTGDDEVFVFLFDKDDGQSVKIAAWTTSKEPKEITIPCPNGKFHAVSYLGKELPAMTADKDGLKLTVSDGPIYLAPEKMDDFWSKLARINPILLAYCLDTKGASRSRTPAPVIRSETIDGIEIVQKSDCYSVAPMDVSMPILIGAELVATIKNPTGKPYDGIYRLENVRGIELETVSQKVSIKQGEKETNIRFPLKNIPGDKFGFSAELAEGDDIVQFDFPSMIMQIFTDFSKLDSVKLSESWSVVPDGDKDVGSEQKIEIDSGKLKLTFKYDEGWKFVRIFPKDENARKFEGKPKALAFQVKGDGTPVSINIRYRDGKGQTFQVPGTHLRDDSVQSLTFPLDGEKASHWGGPNDGAINYPIQLDSIVVDGIRKALGPGTVTFSSPVVIYE